MKAKAKFSISTSHIIMLSFLAAILIGSLLLSLPISWAEGVKISYLDALFTSTTATCVTGLVTVPTFSGWSIFGQAVILVLIQIGGLGIITVMSGFMIAFHKKMNLGDRLLIQDAFNLNNLSGLIRFVKKVLAGTFIIEFIGALLYMPVFVKDFGLKGVWISIFNSVSAFCNAGIDIIGPNSLNDYAKNPVINLVTILLIILGGIGYIVWWDVIRVTKNIKKGGLSVFRRLTLHSKLAIITTLLLIFGGAVLIFIFEYNNPLTFKDYTLFQKIQSSFFQSVTTRTAGFTTMPQENFTNPSAFLSIFLMFIGGSPVGTAGGVKTVTLLILFASAFATISGRNETSLMNRNITKESIAKALAVVSMSFLTVFVSTVLLSVCSNSSPIDILYETVSATATVGLTRNFTASLNSVGKLIIIATMYLGRIGPISLAIAFNFKKVNKNIIKNPFEDISIG
ncbi:MAG: potassium transporter KtrB [Ruminococcaceae bacterium]|nr:potassium transporter KtrB [Oscillospiraceae bacterium]